MERDFKGVWIPKEIYLDKNLSWTEKILLIEIDSLDGEEGCFASNEHFAKHLMISKDRVSKLISKLNLLGYITVKIIYKNGSKQIEKRILHSTIGYSRKQLEGIVENTDTPIGENTDTPIGENDQDNNTNINNTNINNTINNTFINSIMDAWNSLPIPNIKSIKNQRLKHTKARIKEVGEEEFIKAIESINQSSFLQGKNNRGWVISYDWFVNPNNFTKVIEGKYIDKQEEKKEEQTEWHGVWDVEKDMNSEW